MKRDHTDPTDPPFTQSWLALGLQLLGAITLLAMSAYLWLQR